MISPVQQHANDWNCFLFKKYSNHGILFLTHNLVTFGINKRIKHKVRDDCGQIGRNTSLTVAQEDLLYEFIEYIYQTIKMLSVKQIQ